MLRISTSFGICLWLSAMAVSAQDAGQGTKIELAQGKLSLVVPADWKPVPPKSSIVEYEFMAPKSESKAEMQARVTVMQAGGGVQANVDRWYGQFEQPDKSSTKDKAKVEKFEVAGSTVHFVDISGIYKDSMGGGPFAPKPSVLRTNYRKVGAIIQLKDSGDFYLTITGPNAVVEKQIASMKKMLQEMKAK